MRPLVRNARSKQRKAAVKQDQLAQVAAVRAVVGISANRYSDQQLLGLCRYVRARGGDVGVVTDALLMIPRPAFLQDLLGRTYSVPVK